MSNYYVADAGNGMMKVTNTKTGAQEGTVSYSGTVISPPIVNGNQCSFIVEDSSGQKTGWTVQLPNGQRIGTFRA